MHIFCFFREGRSHFKWSPAHDARISNHKLLVEGLVNCWLRVWGMFPGYVGILLESNIHLVAFWKFCFSIWPSWLCACTFKLVQLWHGLWLPAGYVHIFFPFWFIRPSRWSFPLEARGRRPSSSSSCRSSSPLVGPAKHEGPIKAIQSSWTCSSLVSLLGLFALFLSEVLEATCLFVFFLQLADPLWRQFGLLVKRLLSTDMASSKQFQAFSASGEKRWSSTAVCQA